MAVCVFACSASSLQEESTKQLKRRYIFLTFNSNSSDLLFLLHIHFIIKMQLKWLTSSLMVCKTVIPYLEKY